MERSLLANRPFGRNQKEACALFLPAENLQRFIQLQLGREKKNKRGSLSKTSENYLFEDHCLNSGIAIRNLSLRKKSSGNAYILPNVLPKEGIRNSTVSLCFLRCQKSPLASDPARPGHVHKTQNWVWKIHPPGQKAGFRNLALSLGFLVEYPLWLVRRIPRRNLLGRRMNSTRYASPQQTAHLSARSR